MVLTLCFQEYYDLTSTIHGLMMSYPDAAKSQARISQDAEILGKHSHAVIPAFMGPDGFGRWDVLILIH